MEPPLPGLPLRDPVAALTHIVTSLFGVYVTLLFWRLARGDRTKRLSLACFGVSMVVLYAASGLYHAVLLPYHSPALEVLRRLDHSAIFLLIAGTYTPVFAVLMTGRRRGAYLAAMWLLTCAGIALKWLMPSWSIRWSIAIYLALGWIGLLPLPALWQALGWRGVLWAFVGGLFYTAGAVCELTHWPVLIPGYVAWHEVFHMCDMAGTGAHIVLMLGFVLPYRRPADAAGADALLAGEAA